MVLAWAGQYPVILKAAHFQPRAGEVTWPGCLPAAPVILTVLMVRLAGNDPAASGVSGRRSPSELKAHERCSGWGSVIPRL